MRRLTAAGAGSSFHCFVGQRGNGEVERFAERRAPVAHALVPLHPRVPIVGLILQHPGAKAIPGIDDLFRHLAGPQRGGDDLGGRASLLYCDGVRPNGSGIGGSGADSGGVSASGGSGGSGDSGIVGVLREKAGQRGDISGGDAAGEVANGAGGLGSIATQSIALQWIFRDRPCDKAGAKHRESNVRHRSAVTWISFNRWQNAERRAYSQGNAHFTGLVLKPWQRLPVSREIDFIGRLAITPRHHPFSRPSTAISSRHSRGERPLDG